MTLWSGCYSLHLHLCLRTSFCRFLLSSARAVVYILSKLRGFSVTCDTHFFFVLATCPHILRCRHCCLSCGSVVLGLSLDPLAIHSLLDKMYHTHFDIRARHTYNKYIGFSSIYIRFSLHSLHSFTALNSSFAATHLLAGAMCTTHHRRHLHITLIYCQYIRL